MHLFRAPFDTCLDRPLVCQPLSSRFALHGLRAFVFTRTVASLSVHGLHFTVYAPSISLGRLKRRVWQEGALQTCHLVVCVTFSKCWNSQIQTEGVFKNKSSLSLMVWVCLEISTPPSCSTPIYLIRFGRNSCDLDSVILSHYLEHPNLLLLRG